VKEPFLLEGMKNVGYGCAMFFLQQRLDRKMLSPDVQLHFQVSRSGNLLLRLYTFGIGMRSFALSSLILISHTHTKNCSIIQPFTYGQK